MGHFGMTRTKQMLRAKYWFPRLYIMVEDVITRCYQCQISTTDSKQEPVKPSEIPETAWHTLSVDFLGTVSRWSLQPGSESIKEHGFQLLSNQHPLHVGQLVTDYGKYLQHMGYQKDWNLTMDLLSSL